MTEAIIPVEVGELTIRRQMFDLTLDLVNELHDKSKIREAACKLRAARHYNTKVQPRSFQKGNLVWRMRSDARKNEGKFSFN